MMNEQCPVNDWCVLAPMHPGQCTDLHDHAPRVVTTALSQRIVELESKLHPRLIPADEPPNDTRQVLGLYHLYNGGREWRVVSYRGEWWPSKPLGWRELPEMPLPEPPKP